MSIKVHKITQGNAYLDGVNLLGQVESVDLPDVKFVFDEFKAMGMVGKVDLPTTGIEKLEGKIKFNSLYPEVAKTLSPFRSRQLQVRSNVQTHGNQGVSSNVPLVTFMTITFKTVPMGQFEQHKNHELEYEFACTYLKQVYDGYEVLEYDAMANILKFNGEDVLKDYRENLGM